MAAKTARAEVLALYKWVSTPYSIVELYGILRKLTDSELLELMQSSNLAVVRISWAEYGKRHAGLELTFTLRVDNVLDVVVGGVVVGAGVGIV